MLWSLSSKVLGTSREHSLSCALPANVKLLLLRPPRHPPTIQSIPSPKVLQDLDLRYRNLVRISPTSHGEIDIDTPAFQLSDNSQYILYSMRAHLYSTKHRMVARPNRTEPLAYQQYPACKYRPSHIHVRIAFQSALPNVGAVEDWEGFVADASSGAGECWLSSGCSCVLGIVGFEV